MSEFSSLLKQNNISLYKHTILYISICKLIETRVCSTFWLFWIMLPWTWVYKYLIASLLSFPFVIQPQVELLNHLVVLSLVFWGISILFSTAAIPFYIITSSAKGSNFSPTFVILLLIIVILMGIQWYLIVVYTYLFLYYFFHHLIIKKNQIIFYFKSKSSKIFWSLHNKLF